MFNEENCEYFSSEVSDSQLAALQVETRHVIIVLEVLPALVACALWSSQMLHRRCFIFVDNDGARACLIRMHSKSKVIRDMLRRGSYLQAATPSFVWFSRVPSASNVADAPSRPEASLRSGFFQRVVPGR